MTQEKIKKIAIAWLAFAASVSQINAAAPQPSFDTENSQVLTIQSFHRSQQDENSPTPVPVSNDRYWVQAEASDAAARTQIANAGVGIEEIQGSQVTGLASLQTIDRLQKMGIRFKMSPTTEMVTAQDFPAPDSAFHNYSRMQAELNSLASSAPGIASLFSIGHSVQGRDLLAIEISAGNSKTHAKKKSGIVFMGTHHAREHLSTEIPLLLAQYLITHRNDPDIYHLLKTRDIYIIPMVNPDGVEYDIKGGHYHLWRKNRRRFSPFSYGVDLNRNYGYHWGTDGASQDPNDETYAGPAAFSEPETQAVKHFIESHPNITTLLSYHSFSELILYPWGYTDSPISDGNSLRSYQGMANAMAKLTGYTPEQSSALYTTSGDTTDWAWGAHHIYSFTIELTPTDNNTSAFNGFYPGASAIAPTFAKNLPAALYLIQAAGTSKNSGSLATQTPRPLTQPVN